LSETENKGGSRLGSAILGGVIGAVLTAGALVAAGPQLFGERLVREALLADPEILVDTADALRDRQYAPTLAANRAAIETPFANSWKGAAKPEVVLVEFHDYACTYCRASNPHIERLLKEDPGLRVVYRDLPILGPNSVTAARLALAASKAGRFHQFHDAAYAAGRPSPETLAGAAAAAGLPPQPPASPDIEAELKKNFELAGQLGATGTPLFVVGNRVMNSAVGYDALKDAIADARSARS
jgi:protein-disulfide isomerase